MESNKCLGCRFGSVKIEVEVPEKYSTEEFAAETKNFASQIIAITKQKSMQYLLTFGSINNFSKLEFKIHYSCKLNIDKKQCSKFSSNKEKDCRINYLIYSKGISDQIEVKMQE